MTSLLKKLSISIKIGVIKRYGVCLVSFQTVDRIRRQSSWASCECVHTADADTTKQFRRVGGVYWALHYKFLTVVSVGGLDVINVMKIIKVCKRVLYEKNKCLQTYGKQAVVLKHNKPRPRVAHSGIAWFLGIDQKCNHGHSAPSLKISCKSVQPFSRNLAHKDTKKQRYKERYKEIDRKQYPVGPVPRCIGDGAMKM